MKKVLVIAPRYAQKNLLSFYRKENVFSDIKIMSREEVYHSVYSSFDKNHLIYLYSKKDASLDFLEEVTSFFPYVEDKDYQDEALNNIVSYKKIALEDHKEASPFYPELNFKDRDVHVYYYDRDDFYLDYVFNLFNIKAEYKTEDYKLRPTTLHYFHLADDEVLYTLNKICEILTNEDTNIHLVIRDDAYRLILNKYAPFFNLKINNLIQKSLISNPICISFLNNYELSHDILDSVKKTSEEYAYSEYLDLLVNTIDLNTYDFLPFDKQIAVFRKAFNDVKISSATYEKGIDIIDSPTFSATDHIFFLGFSQDDFPQFFKESSYIDAEQKDEINYPTALIKNRVSTKDMTNFLKCESHIHLSFSEYVNNQKKYPSILVNDPNYLISVDHENKVLTYFSKYYSYIKLCKALDKKNLYLESSDDYVTLNANVPEFNEIYSSFDYSFTGVNVINPDYTMSYSSANAFISCQFKYFMQKVVGISDTRQSFYLNLGTFAHRVFQNSYKDGKFDQNLDFDKVYEECKHDINFSTGEMILVDHKIKDLIKQEVDFLAYQDSHFINPTYYTEKYIKDIPVEDSKIKVKGIIDKVVITDNKYMFFIDYKSKETVFREQEIKTGKSLQLATYLMISDSLESFEGYKLSGLFYNTFLPQKLDVKGVNDKEYMLLRGKIIDNDEIISSFDPTNSIIKRSNRQTSNPFASQEDFDSYIGQAKEVYQYISSEIEDNSYPIDPHRNGAKDSCKNCPYRDICFYDGLELEEDEEEEDNA
ncbi:MAG: PD-(D/E)XK nuclease family protein [Coprobacillus sp.]|nr:PD-(D/E)XK nuclease family protein [Coprobacillus sp.]